MLEKKMALDTRKWASADPFCVIGELEEKDRLLRYESIVSAYIENCVRDSLFPARFSESSLVGSSSISVQRRTEGFEFWLVMDEEKGGKVIIRCEEKFKHVADGIGKLKELLDQLVSGEAERVEETEPCREWALTFRSKYSTLRVCENQDSFFVFFENTYSQPDIERSVAYKIDKASAD